MDEYFVTSVSNTGIAATTRHPSLEAAEKAFDAEKARVTRKEVVGVGMDQQDSSGSARPLKSFMISGAPATDVFINSCKEQRRRGYPAS